MKKYLPFVLIIIFSVCAAVTSYSVGGGIPETEEAWEEARKHAEALPETITEDFMLGGYKLDGYETAVSKSFVENFIKEAEALPALADFDLKQYGETVPQILFLPKSMLFLREGFAYDGKIAINLGNAFVGSGKYKQTAAHELFHIGTNGLSMEWLDEAFAVLFTQRMDEAQNREVMTFEENAKGRNDFRIGELLAQLIGGEEILAGMASDADAFEQIAARFDAAQDYISFEDFSFANVSIRHNNDSEEEAFVKNLEYLEYIAKNPRPAKDDSKINEIREFYAFSTRETSVKYANALNGFAPGRLTTSQTLDDFTRTVVGVAYDDILFYELDEAKDALDEAALTLAMKYLTQTDGLHFAWEDGITAMKLSSFAEEQGLSLSPKLVMEDAALYALSGELLETAFGENAINIEEKFKERTGKDYKSLLSDKKQEMPPDEMLGQILDVCFVQPVKKGVVNKEQAARELSGFREKNYRLLEARELLEKVDAALAEINS